MGENKWRFPASNHGERKGISSGDTEAFKKSPYYAFAREILQNSIDARDSDEEPTIVEFKEFDMNVSDIPGVAELKDSIRRCKEYWNHKVDYVKIYENMETILNSDTIHCLRISDYNTTGLVGIDSSKQDKNKFLALTKGTGVSEKSGNVAGGSKGVGKNAAFLMSSLRTVFYSSHANQNLDEEYGSFLGSIGVAELVSGYVDDEQSENRDYTQGTGYFSNDEFNNPLPNVLMLDPSQNNRNTKSGTDLFVLGFISSEDWEKEVINSILDSFMATIVYGHLEVVFNDIIIDKNTVESVVYNDSLILKNEKANIISQYRLLKGQDDVSVYDIETEYGNCQLYILPYKKDEEELATHKCTMIRHPLMKIKNESLGSSFRVSALCIIGEGKLGETLRAIENPQHIDWETKRISDKRERKEIETILKDIKEQIKQKVIECLQIGDNNPLDPNGAGDYLPDTDIGDSNNDSKENEIPTENVSVSKPKENITVENNPRRYSDFGTGLEPDIGEIDSSDEGDVLHPKGKNEGDGSERHPGLETSGKKDGEEIIYKKAKLAGVRYKVISTDRNNGKIRVVFLAPIDYDKCYLNVSMLDDSNNSRSINILKMKANNIDIECSDSTEYGPFSIKTNQKVILDIETDSKGYFGSEVKVICK